MDQYMKFIERCWFFIVFRESIHTNTHQIECSRPREGWAHPEVLKSWVGRAGREITTAKQLWDKEYVPNTYSDFTWIWTWTHYKVRICTFYSCVSTITAHTHTNMYIINMSHTGIYAEDNMHSITLRCSLYIFNIHAGVLSNREALPSEQKYWTRIDSIDLLRFVSHGQLL